MLISDVVLSTFGVAKKLGRSELDAKPEDDDTSDGFVGKSVEVFLELREPVVPNTEKDIFDELESSALEVPKVNVDLGSSEGGVERSFAFGLKPNDTVVEDEDAAGGKENALEFIAGVTPNEDRLSLVEADVAGLADKLEKAGGGFGIAN